MSTRGGSSAGDRLSAEADGPTALSRDACHGAVAIPPAAYEAPVKSNWRGRELRQGQQPSSIDRSSGASRYERQSAQGVFLAYALSTDLRKQCTPFRSETCEACAPKCSVRAELVKPRFQTLRLISVRSEVQLLPGPLNELQENQQHDRKRRRPFYAVLLFVYVLSTSGVGELRKHRRRNRSESGCENRAVH